MKKLLLMCAFVVSVTIVWAQHYTPSDAGSEVKFSIKNFGLNVTGTYKGLKGDITFNPANLPAASFRTTVQVETVNTGNGSRDSHLKKEEYFDAAKYPQISFVSTKISNAATAGTFIMEGKITIKGVTKSVSFPFTATAKQDGFLFAGEFKLNRKDFGVGGNSMVLSDKLLVVLSIFAKKTS